MYNEKSDLKKICDNKVNIYCSFKEYDTKFSDVDC